MNQFLVLFKNEFKMQFPFGKKKSSDILGAILSAIITLMIIAVISFLLFTIVKNYSEVKVNKVEARLLRAEELINVFYFVIIGFLSIYNLEKMRKSFSEKKNKEIFLRLPIREQTLFLSKISVLALWSYIIGLCFIVPVNILFHVVVGMDFTFVLKTIPVCLFLPLVSFFISGVLIIPYIRVIDFIKKRYVLVFILLTLILIGGFWIYSYVLKFVEELLETGSIKFIFNEGFINTLQILLKFLYPSNLFAQLMFEENVVLPIILIIVISAAGGAFIYFITKYLFNITLYKDEDRVTKIKKKESYNQLSPVVSLMKKEFISVFRDSKHVFSYFAIACAMPVMVYSCYTLFDSLIYNTLGLHITFSLALVVVLLFSVLTNTFCSTNISRDGIATLKTKVFPIPASKILLAKVLFCFIVSSLSVLVSVIVLMVAARVGFVEGIVCLLLGIAFSIAQIFVATRMDLNDVKLSLSNYEMEARSSKTIAKVVAIGLVLAVVIGISSLILAVFGSNNAFLVVLAYVIPVVISAAYLGFAVLFYMRNIEDRYNKVTL